VATNSDEFFKISYKIREFRRVFKTPSDDFSIYALSGSQWLYAVPGCAADAVVMATTTMRGLIASVVLFVVDDDMIIIIIMFVVVSLTRVLST